MARVTFVKKARKDIPGTDIKRGDSYYHWSFRYGGRRTSKTPPRRSQLTQSSFLSQVYDVEDEIEDLVADETLGDAVSDIASRLRDIAGECQDSLDNMPEGLQQGDTGQMLQERIDGCEAAADELENLTFDIGEKEEDQTEKEFWEDKLSEVQDISIDYP